MDKVEQTINDLDYITKNVGKLRKKYLKELQKERRELQMKIKQYDANKYYLSPVKVSCEFIQFFRLLPEHEYSRVYCYRRVFEYLKKNQLLTLGEVTVSSDVACLFKDGDVTLFNLYKRLEWHFE